MEVTNYKETNVLLQIAEVEIAKVLAVKKIVRGIYWYDGNMQIHINRFLVMEWHRTLFAYPECFQLTLQEVLKKEVI